MKVALDLLDSAQGHPIQTWRFEGRSALSIGRGEDSDVMLADPRVSRLHAELEFGHNGWRLISKGRNGVLIDGLQIVEQSLKDKTTFQLGSAGPLLRFREDHPALQNMATLDGIDTSIFAMLQIDEQRKEEEVRAITGAPL
ncbi:MAG TPA: FHA domain-containing protein, partial [Nitrospiraceae bacterium]|nr:FHA domain-containing protein [Nitrospiraceae bacterium]